MEDKESIKEIFERWAHGGMGISMEWFHPPLHKWWLKRLDLSEDSRVLDIGCGTGWASRMVAKLIPNGEVVGIDIAEGMIEIAKQKADDHQNISFRIANVENIPYPHDYFDCLISIESFGWFPDPEAALREMKRVLKIGGKFYIADGYNTWINRLLIKAFKPWMPGIDKYNLYAEDHIKQLVENEFSDIYQEVSRCILLTVGTKTKSSL
ncbi:MAG: methyltransferase domain-containing protein [bacterium]